MMYEIFYTLDYDSLILLNFLSKRNYYVNNRNDFYPQYKLEIRKGRSYNIRFDKYKKINWKNQFENTRKYNIKIIELLDNELNNIITKILTNTLKLSKETMNKNKKIVTLFLKERKVDKSSIKNIIKNDNIEELKLYYLNIKKIPKEINNMINLKYLNLSFGSFDYFPCINDLENLETLDLSRGNVSKIYPIHNLTNLKKLYLNDNYINNIELINLINLGKY